MTMKMIIGFLAAISGLTASSGCGTHPRTEDRTSARPAPSLSSDERWYGVMLNDGYRQPYDTIAEWDLAHYQCGGAAAPMLLSTEGRYIWSDRPFVFCFTNGVPMIVETRAKLVRGRAGVTLRDAYLEMMKKHFPFDGRQPPKEFFEKPQFNNWMEMICLGFGKKAVDDYITGLETNGYPCGVFELDAGLQTYHGSNAFDPEKVPDPKALVARIHRNGWKALLWTSFNIRGETPVAKEFEKYCVKTTQCKTYHFKPGPNGRYSVVWDLTDPKAYEVFAGRLRAFADEIGFDGYKFDMGDPFNFTKFGGGYVFADRKATPSDYTRLYATLAERFPYHEFRIGYCSGGKPIIQRLADKSHTWDHLKRMSTDVQAGGLLGSPYCVPDMIGGGQESDWKKSGFKPDEKLFVRMAAIQAMQPLMQFSVAPWRVLSAEGNAICKCYAELHVKMAPYILEEVAKTAKTGEPLVRMMEYAYPHQGFARTMTQFMLGDRYLVAPVCEPDDSVVVELPAGRWRDDLGELHVGPKKLNLEKVPLDRLPHYRLETL